MLIQIGLGSFLILVTILIAGLSIWAMETGLYYSNDWLRSPPHRVKMMVMLCVAALWVLAQVTVGVWIWAFTFYWLDIFDTLEIAVYFSLVSFTTLGFGDVLLPQEWRLLAGMASANGLLNMGLLTAILVEVVRQIRIMQRAAIADDRGA